MDLSVAVIALVTVFSFLSAGLAALAKGYTADARLGPMGLYGVLAVASAGVAALIAWLAQVDVSPQLGLIVYGPALFGGAIGVTVVFLFILSYVLARCMPAEEMG